MPVEKFTPHEAQGGTTPESAVNFLLESNQLTETQEAELKKAAGDEEQLKKFLIDMGKKLTNPANDAERRGVGFQLESYLSQLGWQSKVGPEEKREAA